MIVYVHPGWGCTDTDATGVSVGERHLHLHRVRGVALGRNPERELSVTALDRVTGMDGHMGARHRAESQRQSETDGEYGAKPGE